MRTLRGRKAEAFVRALEQRGATGLARVECPANMEAFIRQHLYKPEY